MRERPCKHDKTTQAEDLGDVPDGEELSNSIRRIKLYNL